MAYTLKEFKDDEFNKTWQGISKPYLVEPYNILLPSHAPEILKRLQTFVAEDDDIYVVTFVKAGTALMQEIVHLLHNGIDPEAASKVIREFSFPYLEIAVWDNPENFLDSINLLESNPRPRLIKTHLHYDLMPPKAIEKKCKMIYVARNIRDVVVSYFHFAQKLNSMQFSGEFSDFAELFLKDFVPYCPFVKHVQKFWERRKEPNILFVTYEEMRMDLPSVVKKTAEFFGKTVTDQDIQKIVTHCNFDNMKQNPAVNKELYTESKLTKKGFSYLRKGIVGDWKNHFSPALAEKYTKYLDENVKDPELKKIIECPI